MEKDVGIFLVQPKRITFVLVNRYSNLNFFKKTKQAHLFGGYNQEALHLNDTIGGSARVGKSVDNVPYSPPPSCPFSVYGPAIAAAKCRNIFWRQIIGNYVHVTNS